MTRVFKVLFMTIVAIYSMKRLFYLIAVVVGLSMLVIGVGMTTPRVNATGRFALGGNLGLEVMVIIAVVAVIISFSNRENFNVKI